MGVKETWQRLFGQQSRQPRVDSGSKMPPKQDAYKDSKSIMQMHYEASQFATRRRQYREIPPDYIVLGDAAFRLEQAQRSSSGKVLGDDDLFIQDSWPVMGRDPDMGLVKIVELMHKGVRANTLPEDVLRSIAFIDRTRTVPIDKAEAEDVENTNYGWKGILKNPQKTKVYIVTNIDSPLTLLR